MKRRILALSMVFYLAAGLVAWAADTGPIKPKETDKCPVCGMFSAKYPDFVTEIVFNDSSYVVFDGMKDLMKYYLDMNKYDKARTPSAIRSIYATSYYSLNFIDARTAFYVQGSDVLGPMGHEFIPFEKEAEARQFMTDHQGKAILKFHEITREMIVRMD